MTDKQINIAIARACGWKSFEETDGDSWLWARTTQDGRIESTMEVLPYCADRNAMADAEKLLTSMQLIDYITFLSQTTYEAALATARQRAEAFLLTLGKWSATTE
jgi:hypothetical protein